MPKSPKAVAVPVRGAGCIISTLITFAESTRVEVAVPVRGAGCIDLARMELALMTSRELPSP